MLTGLLGLVYRSPSAEPVPAEGETQRLANLRPPLSIGAIEGLTVLGAVVALFGVFMAIQGAYLFGGLATLERTGMTYADYARRGFFELVTVAALAFGLVCGLAVITRRESQAQRRWFCGVSGALIVLVIGLLISAWQRMALYQQAYGYTQLRLYTQAFMVWLAVALVLLLIALLRERPLLVSIGGLISGLAVLAALNVLNPDAMIVRENIARATQGSELDSEYFYELSADAVPTLRFAATQLPAPQRASIETAVTVFSAAYERRLAEDGFVGWHLGRWLATQGRSAQ
jgi:Domain of unknown function (DUF4173)